VGKIYNTVVSVKGRSENCDAALPNPDIDAVFANNYGIQVTETASALSNF
jgi:hypothetical protein